ncbi:glycosyltransferase, partial [Flavobacteriaceae bacterium]|nr:glycosyltransferase [Flavobacteriaceae bacterium]
MKLAIVILNWNGKKLLEEFLPSIIRYADSADVYVIDNASTDDSVVFLTHTFPTIKQVVLTENFGFAKGYNEGLKQIDADLYCLLNNDVEVTENWLKPLIQAFEKTNVSIAQPLLLQHKERSRF